MTIHFPVVMLQMQYHFISRNMILMMNVYHLASRKIIFSIKHFLLKGLWVGLSIFIPIYFNPHVFDKYTDLYSNAIFISSV